MEIKFWNRWKKEKEVEQKNEEVAELPKIEYEKNSVSETINLEKNLKDLIKEYGVGFQYKTTDHKGNLVTMEVVEIVNQEGGGFLVHSRSV